MARPAARDLDTPQNLYTAKLTLRSGGETVDETLPERFGFREFGIDGQNYMLNGSVIHLRSLPPAELQRILDARQGVERERA